MRIQLKTYVAAGGIPFRGEEGLRCLGHPGRKGGQLVRRTSFTGIRENRGYNKRGFLALRNGRSKSEKNYLSWVGEICGFKKIAGGLCGG